MKQEWWVWGWNDPLVTERASSLNIGSVLFLSTAVQKQLWGENCTLYPNLYLMLEAAPAPAYASSVMHVRMQHHACELSHLGVGWAESIMRCLCQRLHTNVLRRHVKVDGTHVPIFTGLY